MGERIPPTSGRHRPRARTTSCSEGLEGHERTVVGARRCRATVVAAWHDSCAAVVPRSSSMTKVPALSLALFAAAAATLAAGASPASPRELGAKVRETRFVPTRIHQAIRLALDPRGADLIGPPETMRQARLPVVLRFAASVGPERLAALESGGGRLLLVIADALRRVPRERRRARARRPRSRGGRGACLTRLVRSADGTARDARERSPDHRRARCCCRGPGPGWGRARR